MADIVLSVSSFRMAVQDVYAPAAPGQENAASREAEPYHTCSID
jgi:hypothetical protein